MAAPKPCFWGLRPVLSTVYRARSGYCQMPQKAGTKLTIKEDGTMRDLQTDELSLVFGGHSPQVCTPASAQNDYNGIRNTNSVGDDLINIYEGLVAATSHIIERVALAL